MTSPSRPYAPETRGIPQPSHGSLIYTFADCGCIGSLTNEGWYMCKSPRTVFLSCDMNRYKGTCPYGFAHVRSEV